MSEDAPGGAWYPADIGDHADEGEESHGSLLRGSGASTSAASSDEEARPVNPREQEQARELDRLSELLRKGNANAYEILDVPQTATTPSSASASRVASRMRRRVSNPTRYLAMAPT